MHRCEFATRVDHAAGTWPSRPYCRSAVKFLSVVVLAIALGSCKEAPSDCDLVETRSAVIRIAGDDDHAALVNFAIRNSNIVAETVNNSASTKARDANLARTKAIDDERAKVNDKIEEIKNEYQAKLQSWEEDGEKRGTKPTTEERDSTLARIEQQSNEAAAPYVTTLAALQEERAHLQSEYVELNAKAETEKAAIWGTARQGAVFALDDTILTNSRSPATRSVTCSGVLYVKVEDTAAQKQVEFRVERGGDGTTSVSVNRFLF
jgi:hypothetical protein